MAKPTDTRLYARIKSNAKRKFASWPSARASQYMVAEYKRRGGRYSGHKGLLSRWTAERWVNLCTSPMKPCGTPGALQVCRPSRRVSRSTPRPLAHQVSPARRAALCEQKRRFPWKRLRF